MSSKEFPASHQVLDELAAQIRAALKAAREAQSNALDRALEAGDALNAAQERVSSGWKKWLRTNCFLSPSTALLYQQLARHRSEIEAKIEEIGELSLRAARRLVTKEHEEAEARVGRADGRGRDHQRDGQGHRR